MAVTVTTVPTAYVPPAGVGWAAMDPAATFVSVSTYCAVKVAVTLLAASIVTLQGLLLPVQAPDQLVNQEPGAGVAVRVTTVPAAYFPTTGAGWAAIDPPPSVVRNSVYCAVKVAVTLLGRSIVTTQVTLLPEQSPAQPVNRKPGSGAAVRVTLVPAAYFPAVGGRSGVIDPPPSVVRNSVYCAVKVAVTLLAASIITTQVTLLPEQAPAQPVNRKPGSGVAVRVTLVPAAYFPAVGGRSGVIEPPPSVVSNSVYCAVKLAVTLLAASIVTLQVTLAPEQAPDHPAN